MKVYQSFKGKLALSWFSGGFFDFIRSDSAILISVSNEPLYITLMMPLITTSNLKLKKYLKNIFLKYKQESFSIIT